MSYAFFYDVPGDEAMYQQVKGQIGDEVAEGLMLHLVTKIDGGLRHLNVWKTTARLGSAYRRERRRLLVSGAVAGLSRNRSPAGPPVEQALHLVDLEVGRSAHSPIS